MRMMMKAPLVAAMAMTAAAPAVAQTAAPSDELCLVLMAEAHSRMTEAGAKSVSLMFESYYAGKVRGRLGSTGDTLAAMKRGTSQLDGMSDAQVGENRSKCMDGANKEDITVLFQFNSMANDKK
ncbi:MAG: hypothetical protein RL702_1620 [Pseudomonadota bacterium]|jgi:hypothetical protein